MQGSIPDTPKPFSPLVLVAALFVMAMLFLLVNRPAVSQHPDMNTRVGTEGHSYSPFTCS